VSRVFRAIAEPVPMSMMVTGMSTLLMTPTLDFPTYAIGGGKIKVLPSSYSGTDSLDCTYIRTPKTPKWTYTTVLGNAVYNPTASDHQDFEIGAEDEDKLVVRILKYAGVSIRQDQVAGFAKMYEQNEQKNS
jgi:hypothetical protein